MLDSIKTYSHRHPRTYAATIAASGVAIGFAAFRFRDHLGTLPATLVMFLAVAFVCVGAIVGWFGDRYWAIDEKWTRALDWQDVQLRPLAVTIFCSVLMLITAVLLLHLDKIIEFMSR